jgi:ABC-type uncharacterized transport system permease subunit
MMARTITARGKLGSAALALAAAAAVLALPILEVMSSETEPQLHSPAEPPALWDAPVVHCPATPARAAWQLGQSQAQLARLKHARRQFSVPDAVAAVPLYEQAAACFRHAHKPRHAAEQAALAAALRSELSTEFRTRQLHLERALQEQDWPVVLLQLRRLREFVRQRSGDYHLWLSTLERRAALQRAQEDG